MVRQIIDLRNRYTVKNAHQKLAVIDGRVFFNPNNTGWPGKHFNRLFEIEARNVIDNDVSNLENLRLVLIALTKKCALNCEHCYEGPELNKKETLTLDDHKKILKKLQDVGISMIHYGGGDPMNRVQDLVELLEFSENTSDFWIFTSGFNFTESNAKRLKKAGLTGVSISLDHHDPEVHNKFRRHKDAYTWAMDAAENALKAKLAISLSICVTRDFCTEEHLTKYLKLGKKMGAAFIQILEPRAVGNWLGQDVLLRPDELKVVEDFFLKTNEDKRYRNDPIVLFPGYHQRKSGCPGAASKYVYIDTDGYMNNCPFCRNKSNHILDSDHEKTLSFLKNEGCGMFDNLN
ncbi:MAG: MoaA/NifB/PqqE/SkfB family radical SAM enzyme [Bacteroidia bacterium]